jgi:hypothetical protein
MSTNPRKHRAPFRPVDSLSSPQKPSFPAQARKPAPHDETENDSSFVEARSTISYLGDSSSLFEGDSLAVSPQCV